MAVKRLLVAAVVLLLAACGTAGTGPDVAAPSSLPSSSPSSSSTDPSTSPTPAPPDPAELVARADARLVASRVVRRGDVLDVTAVWRVTDRGRERHVKVRSSDGFATATRELVPSRDPLAPVRPPVPPGAPTDQGPCADVAGGTTLCTTYAVGRESVATWTADGGATWSRTDLDLGPRLLSSTPSLRSDTLAVVGGSDGATLFPFERVARSVDGGRTWAARDLPTFEGERAYSSGQVVLGDGRLLTVLSGFSDDGLAGTPAPRHHGLWVSDGDDWTRFAPYEPRFVPPLPTTTAYGPVEGVTATIAPDPVITVTVADGDSSRVYASPDGRVFREVRLR